MSNRVSLHQLLADLSEALNLLKEWQDMPFPDYSSRAQYDLWADDFSKRVQALVTRYEWALKFWVKSSDVANHD